MPHTKHTTPGDYIASELIAAKSRGETFQKPALSAFIEDFRGWRIPEPRK